MQIPSTLKLAIRNFELVQSAHITIAPRMSRTQTIQNMHFRLIGPNLADDYSMLGSEDFTFALERLVAGGNCKIETNSAAPIKAC